jgi:hypothetical protein
MPTGVDVPHVGHRVAPGWRVSPHVEQRIRFARKSLSFNLRPYEPPLKKIQRATAHNPLLNADNPHLNPCLCKARSTGLTTDPKRHRTTCCRGNNVVRYGS